jgi:hypothetical protein
MSIIVEKIFEKIQYPFMIKVLKKLGIEGICINTIQAINDKPIANIILNGDKQKSFPLKLRMRQRCPFSPLFFNIVLEILVRAIRPKKRSKRDWNGKGRTQIIPVCRYDPIPKRSLKPHQKNSYISQTLSAKKQDTKSIHKNQ